MMMSVGLKDSLSGQECLKLSVEMIPYASNQPVSLLPRLGWQQGTINIMNDKFCAKG